MNISDSPVQSQGISLGRAALVAGLGLLIMTFAAPFAEFLVYSKLVVSGNIGETVQNMRANNGLFLAGIFAYLAVFICDLVVAWALYFLLRPVNKSLSLLVAWARLLYTAIAFFAFLKLVTVYQLLQSPDYLSVFGVDQMHAQLELLLLGFRYDWGIGLILFGLHLALLGWLVYRSVYIPRILGILLLVAGSGWVIYELAPFLLPDTDFGFLFVTFLGESFFMLWLLIRGWKIPEPAG